MKAGAFLVSGVALLAAAAMAPPPAYADDAACFSASENGIGLRKQQKLRAALQQLVLCTAPSCPAEVKAECDRRVVELNAAPSRQSSSAPPTRPGTTSLRSP